MGSIIHRRFLPLVVPGLILAAWITATSGEGATLQVLVPPSAVIDSFTELLSSGELADHLRSSLWRLATGFSIGAGLGLGFGILLARSALVAAFADPLGIVHSQAIENGDRSFRVTLNGSAAAQTLTSRFLNHYLGAGVQHVALATGDIFATAQALQERGLERLPIPRNYFDDIEARFGLDPDLVERMAAHAILYDRTDEAEFFQLYSRAFAKRFFFEFVERRGYDAYGAANAAVRLAAQSRFNTDTVY